MILKSSRLYTPNPNNDIYICPLAVRWYRVPHQFEIDAYTDYGRVHVEIDAGFLFDGRSGGPACDFIAPNLGTQAEIGEWLKHDAFGHGVGLSFEDTNDNLRMGLRDNAKYDRKTAGAIHRAVSLSDDWFGEPLPTDRSYPNIKLIHTRIFDK